VDDPGVSRGRAEGVGGGIYKGKAAKGEGSRWLWLQVVFLSAGWVVRAGRPNRGCVQCVCVLGSGGVCAAVCSLFARELFNV
jgi:hypothetical protein